MRLWLKIEFVSIPIANKSIKLPVPSYVDYFIMKVVSARASDIRDIASLICENGVPENLLERLNKYCFIQKYSQ